MDAKKVVAQFVPEQLTRAREIRAMTKTKLAEEVNLSPSTISHYESDRTRPSASSLGSIAMALRFPVDWFARDPIVEPINIDDGFFRSMSSASQYHRRKVLEDGRLISELFAALKVEGVTLPNDHVTPLKRSVRSAESIERYAKKVRSEWGLGLGPIKHPISLLESMGVRVVLIGKEFGSVDAFSCWHEHQPFVFLVSKASSRMHFDSFHETGHLLLHEDVEPGNPDIEDHANRFSSAFLMPKESFGQECPTRWNESAFMGLKRRWHVSIQAAVYRAHQIGAISTSTYRYAFRQINSKGWKKSEPGEWELEQPKLLRKAMNVLEVESPPAFISNRLSISRPHAEYIYAIATNSDDNLRPTDESSHYADSTDAALDGVK